MSIPIDQDKLLTQIVVALDDLRWTKEKDQHEVHKRMSEMLTNLPPQRDKFFTTVSDQSDRENKILYSQKVVIRRDDNSHHGQLILFHHPDGAITLYIYDDNNRYANITFGTPMIRASSSPKTYLALRNLFVAMCEDEASSNAKGNGGIYVNQEILELVQEGNEL